MENASSKTRAGWEFRNRQLRLEYVPNDTRRSACSLMRSVQIVGLASPLLTVEIGDSGIIPASLAIIPEENCV